MKGISTIIATMILVIITISLAGSAYLFVGGVMTGRMSKVISLIDAKANRVIVRNDGTATISSDEIIITVNGQEVEIVNPQDIKPQDTAILKFLPPEPDMESAKVNVMGVSNTLSYTVDIIPHEFRVTADTVGLWHLDSINETNHTIDGTLYHNDGWLGGGVATQTPEVVPSKFGSALHFDGVNDYVKVNDNPILRVFNEQTLEAWIYVRELKYSGVISKWKGGTRNYLLTVYPNRMAYFIMDETTGIGDNVCEPSSLPLQTNQWVHVAGVYDGSTLKIYRNGNLTNSKTTTATIGQQSTSIDFGRYFLGGYFNGTIDEVRIHNQALTHEEILDSIYG